MESMGKHVDWLNFFDFITAPSEQGNVSGQGGGITAIWFSLIFQPPASHIFRFKVGKKTVPSLCPIIFYNNEMFLGKGGAT